MDATEQTVWLLDANPFLPLTKTGRAQTVSLTQLSWSQSVSNQSFVIVFVFFLGSIQRSAQWRAYFVFFKHTYS